MTYADIGAIIDPFKTIMSLLAELTTVKDELSASNEERSRVNRNNTRLCVENRGLKSEVAMLRSENERLNGVIARLGGSVVEKDSSNSSIPPTQQPIAKKIVQHTTSLRKPTGRKPGGQKGHVGRTLAKSDKPNIAIDHKVTICPHCGKPIPEGTSQTCEKTVQVVDVSGPMQPCSISNHNYYSIICPHCNEIVTAPSVTGDCKSVMYGPKLQTMVIYFSVVHSIPYNRIAEIMRDLFMVSSFSEGTVKNLLAKNKEKATPAYNGILPYIAKAKAAGMDETGAYINGELSWFWCLQSRKYCYVFADDSRGMLALERHGILSHLKDLVLCTDRHRTYFNIEVKGHQVCIVHLLRNLQYLNDLNGEQHWSSDIQDLLREAIHTKNTKPPEEINPEPFKKRMRELLEQDVSPYEVGKKRHDFLTMQKGLIGCEEYIFTFLEHPDVPGHNNSSYPNFLVIQTFNAAV